MIGNNIYGGGNSKKTTNSLGYISDNIIYHLDGLYNLGGYSHNSNLTQSWISLNDKTCYRLNSTNNITGDNYYQTLSTDDSTALNCNSLFLTNFTIEIVYSWIDNINNTDYICSNFTGSGGLGIYSRNNIHKITIYNSSLGFVTINGLNTISVNKIYSIQGVFDGSKMLLFENGIKQSEVNITNLYNNTSDFLIGKKCSLKCYSFRLYNSALTESQLLQNYNIDNQRYLIN